MTDRLCIVRSGIVSSTCTGRCCRASVIQRVHFRGAAGWAALLHSLETQLTDFQNRLGKEFELEAYIQELTPLRDRLRLALSERQKEVEPTADELCHRIEALKSKRIIAPAPDRVSPRISAEEPVTAKIRRQLLSPAKEDLKNTSTWQNKLDDKANNSAIALQ